MPAITTSPSGTQWEVASPVVSTRAQWSDPWVPIPRVSRVQCRRTLASGSLSDASFVLHRGDIWKPGDTAFTQQGLDPETILGRWVKIEATATSGKDDGGQPRKVLWYGIVTDAAIQHLGTVVDGLDVYSTSDVIVHCYGPEWLLTRSQVVTSVVDDGSGGNLTVNRGLAFNGFRSDTLGRQHVAGNKHNTRDVFGPTGTTVWNARQILDYLFLRHKPTTPNPDWNIDVGAAGTLLEWYKPVVETHGRTLYDIVNSVIPRERGMAWRLDVDEPLSTIYLRPMSSLQTQITLPGGDELPANPSKVQLNFLDQRHIRVTSRLVSKQTQYNQVKVIGDRSGRVFTARVGHELIPDWTSTQKTAYEQAAVGSSGYSSLEVAEKAQRNDSARLSDTHSRVFTCFKLTNNWNGQANGQDVKQGSEFWQPGLRFEGYLPMLKGYSYASSASAPSNNNLAGSQPEFIRPIMIGTIQLGLPFYEHLDRLASTAFSEYFGFGIQWACHLRPMENQPGIIIDPTAPPHVLAKNQATLEPSEYDTTIDYTTIEATLYVKWDSFCEGVYPETASANEHNQSQVLVISIGDRAKLDYLVPNTVIGLNNGAKVTATGGYLRDDRNYCKDLARAAWEFYGVPRHAISFGLDLVNTDFDVGDLVTEFQDGTLTRLVNCLISSIAWDFEAHATSVQTDFLEIDFGAIV
jgi:hypothetical protein